MIEKEVSPKITGKAVAAAAAILAVPVAAATIGIGQNEQREHNADIAANIAERSAAETEAYEKSIIDAIEATYDESAYIGPITPDQSGSLERPGIELLQSALGADLYADIKNRIYSPLIDSAKQYIPQPGEEFSVVSVDLNPDANDGDEYVIVRPDHVVYTATEIPTPETN